MTFPVGDLTLDQLLEIKVSIEAEINTRLQAELSALDQRREVLLALSGSEPSVNIAPAKYRDPESGKIWSGKGKRPRWFDVNRADEFLLGA